MSPSPCISVSASNADVRRQSRNSHAAAPGNIADTNIADIKVPNIADSR